MGAAAQAATARSGATTSRSTGHSVTSAQNRNVGWPGEAFAIGARELHFHNHAEHWFVADEQTTASARNSVGTTSVKSKKQAGPLYRREAQDEGFAKQLRGELGLVAKEQNERLVIERRHRLRRYSIGFCSAKK